MHLSETDGLGGGTDQPAMSRHDVVAGHPAMLIVDLPDEVHPVTPHLIREGDETVYLAHWKSGGCRFSGHLTAIGEARIGHAQRCQDLLLDVLDVGLSGHFRHDLSQDHKARVGIRRNRARLEHGLSEPLEVLPGNQIRILQRLPLESKVGQRELRRFTQPCAVVEQLTNRDAMLGRSVL